MGGAWREVNSLIENTGNNVQHIKQNSVAVTLKISHSMRNFDGPTKTVSTYAVLCSAHHLDNFHLSYIGLHV